MDSAARESGATKFECGLTLLIPSLETGETFRFRLFHLIDIILQISYHLLMAKLSFTQALEKVESGKLDPAYSLIGEDYYQRFLLTEKITKAKLGSGGSLNKHSLIGRKATPQILEQLLAGVPLFGGATVVIVSDIDKLPEKSQEFVARSLKTLDPSVLFIGSAKKLDGRTSFAKALSSVGTVVETKEIYDNHLPPYVRSRFAARGMAIDEAAVTEFCRIVGSDCGDIENEVEKISIVHADKKRVGVNDVHSYLSESRFFSQFQVAESVASRKPRATFAALRQYLESSGADGRGKLIWALYSQFERLLQVQALSGKTGREDLAGKLRIHPFFLQKLQEQAGQFQPAELVAALRAVYETELADRFSTESKEQIFERMSLRILRPAGE